MLNERQQSVRVWDPALRLVHWSMVILVGTSWYTIEQGLMQWHEQAGIALLTLLLFRLLWGIFGSETARFSQFVCGPRTTLAYLRTLPQRQPSGHVGHNPLGGWSVLAMLSILLFQVGSGLFATDDIFYDGPLRNWVSSSASERLTDLHEANFTLVMLLITVHVLAIAFYRLYKHDNLTQAMITGTRQFPADQAPQAIHQRPLRALALFALSAATVYFALTYFS